jgi:hypothetical protein
MRGATTLRGCRTYRQEFVGAEEITMSNIEDHRAENLPVARPTLPLPSGYLRSNDLNRLPVMNRHDVRFDKDRESRHILTLREIHRQAVQGAALKDRDAYIDGATIEADRRKLTEAKFQLQRAHMESQILAGEDPELKAKFALLDDDYFQSVRLGGLK